MHQVRDNTECFNSCNFKYYSNAILHDDHDSVINESEFILINYKLDVSKSEIDKKLKNFEKIIKNILHCQNTGIFSK